MNRDDNWDHYRKRKQRRDKRQREERNRPPKIKPGTKLRYVLEDTRTPST